MVTEADILLLKSRINELEEKLQIVYRKLNMDYTTLILPVLILLSPLKFRMHCGAATRSKRLRFTVN